MGKNYRKHKEWLHTPRGRASSLLNAYNHKDEKCNRGKGDLTSKWIAENILTKPCVHCGENDWRKIGCNRLDETLPHTKDNVEPCCKKCNDELHIKNTSKKVYQYTLDGELVKIWLSTMECGRNGFTQSAVSACCNGKKYYKTYKGYIWSYEPL